MVIGSTPSAGRSTRARVVYQTLLACAQKNISITTPYFLPDISLRREIIRAIQERNVEVQIITPGKKSDHLLTRRSSRRVWSIVGSTNLDQRSFALNDEVNLIGFDSTLASTLNCQFANDRAESKQVSYEEWDRRPFWERIHEWLGWFLERQQ